MITNRGATQAGFYADLVLMIPGHKDHLKLWGSNFRPLRADKAFYLCRMAEDLVILKGTKAEQYEALLPQIKGLLHGEPDLIANLANVAAALKEQFGWLWVGFYLVKDDELVLGPFQGPVACTRIKKGRGVCGTSWANAATLIVADIEKFPGHIACSSLSRSEIVIPALKHNEVVCVLDVDSEMPDHFDETDKKFLEAIIGLISF